MQYNQDKQFRIKHNYLSEQFTDIQKILIDIENVVKNNSFTLGEEVLEFEKLFGEKINSSYAVSVNSGTDALFLALKAAGIKQGDEVIAPSFTFYATISAIVATGATPVFADIKNDFTIDPESIETKVTDRTKAIVPVHWAGRICDMKRIMDMSEKYGLIIVEDACHAYLATLDGTFAGNFGHIGCFSLHPLKNINVWGDGGMVVTRHKSYAEKIMLLRNHGLIDRDHLDHFGYNSRLDTIQAVVGKHFMEKIDHIIQKRIENAQYLDKGLRPLKQINLPERNEKMKETFQLFSFLCDKRDFLKDYLNQRGVDAKVHYPIPMHLQLPSRQWGYKQGDFPVSEYASSHTLSLPVHEFVQIEDLDFMINSVSDFYR